MIWVHRGKKIPLERYHGVPHGWSAEAILAQHKRLGGRFDLTGPEATEPGAPDWMPQRHAWLQYRQAVQRVAQGVRAGDSACIELAVRYIELHYIGSYSGFLRERLARALKHAPLRAPQQQRLHAHFRRLLLAGERLYESHEFFRLWRRFLSEAQKRELMQACTTENTEARAWLAHKLWPDPRQREQEGQSGDQDAASNK